MAARLDAYTRQRRWPRHLAGDERLAAKECVEFCRELFAARCVMLAIEQGDEPWLTIAFADDSGFTWKEEQEGDFWPIVAVELEDAAFYLHPASDRVTVAGGGDITAADAIAVDLRKLLGDDGVLSAAV